MSCWGRYWAKRGQDYGDIIELLTLHFDLSQHAPTFMKVRDRYLKPPYPAWTATSVAEVAGGALVEIKVTARICPLKRSGGRHLKRMLAMPEIWSVVIVTARLGFSERLRDRMLFEKRKRTADVFQ